MKKRLGVVVLTVTTIGGAPAAVPRTPGASDGSRLTVHEWGTFTSVAGPDGEAVQWRPLTGPSDLPCFVTTLNPNSVKLNVQGGIPGLKALVRMETPVLYFYSPSATTARVSVDFPKGLFSEWYPQATVGIAPEENSRQLRWQIKWSNVEIAPGAKEAFPTEPDGSHYYAARETDAAPVTANSQQEKFLFYRGIASFPVPVKATVARDGNIAVAQGTDQLVDTFILFERRGDGFGYRVVSTDRSELTIARPTLDGTLESLKQDLRNMLIERGLYPREAAAMVETWRDSWFEEGTRVFYIVAPRAVDAILPLTFSPAPSKVARAFVGRMEVITDRTLQDVKDAIAEADDAALAPYARFLEPIASRLLARMNAGDRAKMDTTLSAAYRSHLKRVVSYCK